MRYAILLPGKEPISLSSWWRLGRGGLPTFPILLGDHNHDHDGDHDGDGDGDDDFPTIPFRIPLLEYVGSAVMSIILQINLDFT